MKIEDARILVTGADGFIGSHLVEMLQGMGARVRALCFYNSFNSWGWLDESPLRNELEILSGDVRDPALCRQAVEGVDLVFNLAALIAIPYSYQAPDSYIDTNVRGALNIAQACRTARVGRLIQVSTSEVYGSARQVPINEEHPLQPQSPYSASKIGADAIAMSFFHSFNLPVTIARPFNTYGPRQSARAVIPAIITRILAGNREIQLGDTRPTRDFNFVSDTCRGMIALAQCEEAVGEVVNIGSGSEISIGDLFDLIRNLMDAQVELTHDPERLRPPASEVMRLRCDPGKIRSLTGWEPQMPLEEGLRRTIEWFRQPGRLERYKTDVLNV